MEELKELLVMVGMVIGMMVLTVVGVALFTALTVLPILVIFWGIQHFFM